MGSLIEKLKEGAAALPPIKGVKEVAGKAIDKAKAVGKDIGETVDAFKRSKIPSDINIKKLRQEAANRSTVEPDGTEYK